MLNISNKHTTMIPDVKRTEGVKVDKSNKLGSESATRRVERNNLRDRNAMTSESNILNGLNNTSVATLPTEIDVDPLLQDIMFSNDPNFRQIVMRLYRDIYYNDAIGGSAVDLLSNLPFSEFTLGGVDNDKMLQPFKETIERLNIKTLNSEVSVDFLVTGAFLGSLLYDREKKSFIDVMPHRIEDADIKALPFYSQDPVVQITFPQELRDLFSSKGSPRIESLKKTLGSALVQTLQKEKVELDPISTIYMPRKTFSFNPLGTSYYRRILPIYLIEKNLFRGTLVESSRRQRGILHLTLGEPDVWEPTVEDMEFMTDLFMNADADPLGAIIATRSGINTQELRVGGDFWKVTDIWDTTAQFKMKAMGISDAFLSGDATYSNGDTALTVFMEMLRAYRDMHTRKMFYNKIFPLVSMINGFTVNRKGKIVRKEGLMDGEVDEVLTTLQDGSRLLIPTVHWAKQLKPEGDQAYFDILSTMSEKGVPVPLRAFAAAGGFNLDELLQQRDDDFNVQKKILQYQKDLGELKKEYGPATPEGEEAFASDMNRLQRMSEDGTLLKLLDASVGESSKSTIQRGRGKIGLFDRDYGEASELHDFDHSGKKKHVFNQTRANRKINDNIMKAMKSMAKNGNTPLTRTTTTPKQAKASDSRYLKNL